VSSLPADRVRRAGALLGLVLLLAACGTQQRPQSFNLSGYSASYRQGHADGCAQRRDDRQYRAEGDYMMGWNDGRSACAKTQR